MPPHLPEPAFSAPDGLVLTNDPSSVRTARSYVQDVINGWGAMPVNDLALPTSEVVTNAVVHTDGQITIRVRRVDGHARVEVHDLEPAPPEMKDPDPERHGGWGMRLVNSLAACWGVTNIDNDGKIVWFDIELTPTSATA
ncbi:MAG TPA: ATP-binding protein [Acidimicrobiales bacterium]|nr:ATP-binding protein [Acidimicrobiales bacterium]